MRFPRGPALGLFGVFGRSPDLRRLDEAFRAVDVHPRMVPEAVKLTMLSLLRDDRGAERELPSALVADAAALVGYCLIGSDSFAEANNPDAAAAVERRIEAALLAGTNLDARLVLLTLHAKLVQPSVRDRFGLESDGA